MLWEDDLGVSKTQKTPPQKVDCEWLDECFNNVIFWNIWTIPKGPSDVNGSPEVQLAMTARPSKCRGFSWVDCRTLFQNYPKNTFYTYFTDVASLEQPGDFETNARTVTSPRRWRWRGEVEVGCFTQLEASCRFMWRFKKNTGAHWVPGSSEPVPKRPMWDAPRRCLGTRIKFGLPTSTQRYEIVQVQTWPLSWYWWSHWPQELLDETSSDLQHLEGTASLRCIFHKEHHGISL